MFERFNFDAPSIVLGLGNRCVLLGFPRCSESYRRCLIVGRLFGGKSSGPGVGVGELLQPVFLIAMPLLPRYSGLLCRFLSNGLCFAEALSFFGNLCLASRFLMRLLQRCRRLCSLLALLCRMLLRCVVVAKPDFELLL